MKCLFCGTDNPETAIACSNCGKIMIQKEAQVSREIEIIEETGFKTEDYTIDEIPAEEKTPPNLMLVFGGALMIVAGMIGIVMVIIIGGAMSIVGIMVPGALVLFAIGDLFALISGLCALRKKNFTTAIMLGVLGIGAGLASPFLISSLLALIALGLISYSHNEFP